MPSIGAIFREGARIHYSVAGIGPPVTLLHGFLGSSESWTAIVSQLSLRYRCITVDLIGHGRSDAPADPVRYSMSQCVRDVLAVLNDLGIVRTAVIGYSMGGRVALHLSLIDRSPVRALVSESASPGIESREEREARVREDDRLAQVIEEDGMEPFVAWWEQLPLFAGHAMLDRASRATLHAQRVSTTAVGAANSLRGSGTGRQRSLWPSLGKLKVPALIIAGSEDEKYAPMARRMQQYITGAALGIVEGAGHTVHLEKPDRFLDLVVDFLDLTWKPEGSNEWRLGGSPSVNSPI